MNMKFTLQEWRVIIAALEAYKQATDTGAHADADTRQTVDKILNKINSAQFE